MRADHLWATKNIENQVFVDGETRRLLDLVLCPNDQVLAVLQSGNTYQTILHAIMDEDKFNDLHAAWFGGEHRSVMHKGRRVGRIFQAWSEGIQTWVSAVFYDTEHAEEFLELIEGD